ncbi:hypothetical protein GGF37_003731, partial [Kickxella alabastrina]
AADAAVPKRRTGSGTAAAETPRQRQGSGSLSSILNTTDQPLWQPHSPATPQRRAATHYPTPTDGRPRAYGQAATPTDARHALRDITNAHRGIGTHCDKPSPSAMAAKMLSPPATMTPPASAQRGAVPFGAQQPPNSAPARLDHPGAAQQQAFMQLVAFASRPRAQHQAPPVDVDVTLRQRGGALANAPIAGDGSTLLHAATLNAHWDVVQALLDNGADCTRPTQDGLTPLMLAAGSLGAWRQRDAHIFAWLLDAMPAALCCRDANGRSALHWAVASVGTEWPLASAHYAQLLAERLERMRRPDAAAWRDSRGRTAAELGGRMGNAPAAEALASGILAERAAGHHVPAADRYEHAALRAGELVRAAADEMRRVHRVRGDVLDADMRRAAALLLELRAEHADAVVRARDYGRVAGECVAAARREAALKRRIEAAVNLQQAARALAAVEGAGGGVADGAEPPASPAGRASPASPAGPSSPALMQRALELRRANAAYEAESRRLAREYAELAAVVRPWPAADEGAGAGSGPGPGPGPGADAGPGLGPDAEAADLLAMRAVLRGEEERLHKMERVVAAACGDLSMEKVRNVVGPVLSVLNNGNTLSAD